MRERGSLEARVARLEDILEIHHLIAAYGPLVDIADDDEGAATAASLWLEDGIYDLGPDPHRLHGRERIMEMYRGRHMAMVRTGVAHVAGLPMVSVTGDRATAFGYTCVFRPEGRRFYPWRVAANLWRLERDEGRWVVRERINRRTTGEDAALDLVAEAMSILRGEEQ